MTDNENEGGLGGIFAIADMMLGTAEDVSSEPCKKCDSPGTNRISAHCECGWHHEMCLACYQAGGAKTARQFSQKVHEHEASCEKLKPAVNSAMRVFFDSEWKKDK